MPQTNVRSTVVSRLPRFHVETDFLTAADHASLLQDSLADERNYEPSQVIKKNDEKTEYGVVNTNTRRSARRSLSPKFRDLFRAGVRTRRDRISTGIGVPFPDEHRFEIEAVHNGDGAFFSSHIDTTRGVRARHRVISSVYYFNHEPKRFSGGELKLYSLDQSAFVLVEPQDNIMVFFPSIFPHEVLPVQVPSGEFEAGRFSVNCWINRQE